MPSRIRSYIKLLVAFCLIASFCLVQAEAQTRKKKRTRRATTPAAPRPVITNPPIAPPDETQSQSTSTTGDVKIISTDDPEAQEPTATQPKTATPVASPEQEDIQKTITALSNQVNKLNDKLSQKQDDERYEREMERLTRAEQRAEQLRSQLIDVQAKIADFEAKLEQIDFALRPENIESSTAGYGSTRPEAARDARKKQLEGEKARVQAQLKLVEGSKTRLEVAVANADNEVDLLRAKIQQLRDQMNSQPVNTDPPAKPRKP
jgi:predicted  nucleic acid-binding Zn-ribbon protein